MRSIGIALFVSSQADPISTFYVNLQPQENATEDAQCMHNFWSKHTEAWQRLLVDALPPTEAMEQLATWLCQWRHLSLKWVASPANNDWLWLHHYWYKYAPTNVFDIGFFCHDLNAMLRSYLLIFNTGTFEQLKQVLGGSTCATHHALDDALHQGVVYMNIRRLLAECKQNTVSFVTQDRHTTLLVSVCVQPLPHTAMSE
jgi:hypothetical protein